jgi:hypothetical protein
MSTTAGTIKRVSVYGRTREDCHAKYVELKANAQKGIPVAATNQTVAEYLAYWLNEVARHTLRPATFRSYELSVRLYIVPGLGKKKVDKLQPRDIRTWLNQVRNTCQCCAQGKDAKRPKEHSVAAPSGNAATSTRRRVRCSTYTPSCGRRSNMAYARKDSCRTSSRRCASQRGSAKRSNRCRLTRPNGSSRRRARIACTPCTPSHLVSACAGEKRSACGGRTST